MRRWAKLALVRINEGNEGGVVDGGPMVEVEAGQGREVGVGGEVGGGCEGAGEVDEFEEGEGG